MSDEQDREKAIEKLHRLQDEIWGIDRKHVNQIAAELEEIRSIRRIVGRDLRMILTQRQKDLREANHQGYSQGIDAGRAVGPRPKIKKYYASPDRMVSFDYRVLDGKLVRREYWLIDGQTILKDIVCSNKLRVVVDGTSQEVTLILKNL